MLFSFHGFAFITAHITPWKITDKPILFLRLWSKINKSDLYSKCYYMTAALKIPHLGSLQISFGANTFFNMTVTQYWWWEAQLQVLCRVKIHLQGGQWPVEPQGSFWMRESVIRCILLRHPYNIGKLCRKTQIDFKTEIGVILTHTFNIHMHININGALLCWPVISAGLFSLVS